MVTEYEAAKLRRDMHQELDGASTTVLKCVIGILVVALLALLSLSVGFDPGSQGAPTQAAAR